MRAVSNAVLLDTLPVLCPTVSCQMLRDGKWWWRDNAHISITASHALAPLIAKKMLEAQQLTKKIRLTDDNFDVEDD